MESNISLQIKNAEDGISHQLDAIREQMHEQMKAEQENIKKKSIITWVGMAIIAILVIVSIVL